MLSQFPTSFQSVEQGECEPIFESNRPPFFPEHIRQLRREKRGRCEAEKSAAAVPIRNVAVHKRGNANMRVSRGKQLSQPNITNIIGRWAQGETAA